MAELGPEPQLASAVARLLNRTSEQCGPTRSGLIEKGLLYTHNHGYAAFTVPHFDQFMRRSVPALSVPPVGNGARVLDGEIEDSTTVSEQALTYSMRTSRLGRLVRLVALTTVNYRSSSR
jgi:hypothetical protein